MKNRVSFVVVLGMFCVGAFAQSQTIKDKDVQMVQRIRDVENGLVEFRPGVPASDAPPPKLWTLAERMAFHKIPGVSIT
jgi:hypothetical protein